MLEIIHHTGQGRYRFQSPREGGTEEGELRRRSEADERTRLRGRDSFVERASRKMSSPRGITRAMASGLVTPALHQQPAGGGSWVRNHRGNVFFFLSRFLLRQNGARRSGSPLRILIQLRRAVGRRELVHVGFRQRSHAAARRAGRGPRVVPSALVLVTCHSAGYATPVAPLLRLPPPPRLMK